MTRPSILVLSAMLLAGAATVGSAGTVSAATAGAGEGIPQDVLRVCADPNLLPYSNERGEGFENRIAQLIADELKIPISYTWAPQTFGFVRNTLGARRCDLVMGTAVGEELMQNSNPYYRSTYSLIYRTNSPIKAKDLSDPLLRKARIGVIEKTPPAAALLRAAILQIVPYQLNTDTRVNHPAEQAVADVANGETDAAVIWGPIAGYFATRQKVPLTVVPLPENRFARLHYMISMGIRPDEPDWKHWLNEFIERRRPDIERILTEYGVPLVNADGTIKAASLAVPEPDGYRMDGYQSPTPAGLRGAETVTAERVEALAKEGALLLDVLPNPPKPEGLAEGTKWVPKPHLSIPGAHWLPNIGHGALSAEQEGYFRANLERLTGGDRSKPVVFFCKPDCWMSWNAAKRAVDWGYGNVKWFRDGIGGWEEAGHSLAELRPEAPAVH
ncbi:quinoprotein dehydrogenase-associated putative ABC transporter substrate-binding protein [Azospirillum sp. SYSU D00513]|uniref:quinoprotein dehydrogenase-associated putative ABC transporter substrate-binding protein n=1 Tax=Azospirillum sp. SYSU D00513 TaxID=2812561 RepID=UPI001A95664B|nr:quinoprotein dehydrogenase-associated putative ABC transporter substrate-binding protein [Azospirillum sp. SYSU D00513]